MYFFCRATYDIVSHFDARLKEIDHLTIQESIHLDSIILSLADDFNKLEGKIKSFEKLIREKNSPEMKYLSMKKNFSVVNYFFFLFF